MNLNDGLRELFREIPAQALVANDRSEKQFSDGLLFACTQGTAAQAWTVSLYAALVQTGRDELVKLPRFQAALLRVLIALLAAVFRLGRIDKTVGVQNFGLTTNLYDAAFCSAAPPDYAPPPAPSARARQSSFARSMPCIIKIL